MAVLMKSTADTGSAFELFWLKIHGSVAFPDAPQTFNRAGIVKQSLR
jgi:hypothetical protein